MEKENNQSLRVNVTELLWVTESADSISERKTAEKEIIRICEPIIRLIHGIAKKYHVQLKEIGDDYDPSSGRLVSIARLKRRGRSDMSIVFSYFDSVKSDDGTVTEYKDYVDMPMRWLDTDFPKTFEDTSISSRASFLKAEIPLLTEKLRSMIEELNTLSSENTQIPS